MLVYLEQPTQVHHLPLQRSYKMKKYKTIISPMGDEIIQYEENGVLYTIPKDLGNADYQAYLNPVEHLTDGVK